MLAFYFQPAEFVKNLQYMGVGMIGIFMIVGVIMGATYLINRFTSKLGSKNENDTANNETQPSNSTVITTNSQESTDDTSYTAFVLLGFFFPIIALVLYIIWNDTQKEKALAVGKGGLMSISLSNPIFALIIYLAMKNSNSDIADVCKTCGLISLIVSAIAGIAIAMFFI